MKKLVIAVAMSAMLLTVPGVVLANHDPNQANTTWLGSREFHYLGQTLFNGDPSSPVTFNGTAGQNTFTIYNDSKTKHIVEFEKITGTDAGYEVETELINKNGTATLEVNLTPGLWEVYCPLHDTGKKKMFFYLDVQ